MCICLPLARIQYVQSLKVHTDPQKNQISELKNSGDECEVKLLQKFCWAIAHSPNVS